MPRFFVKLNCNLPVSLNCKILIGSVNGGNSSDLAKKEDIDGFLVGGASLKVIF